MSKIENGGSDQYGEVLSLNGIGGERVHAHECTPLIWSVTSVCACLSVSIVLSGQTL